MKTIIKYACSVCGLEFDGRAAVMEHEAGHFGISKDIYDQWLDLRKAAAAAGHRVGLTKNPHTDAAFHEACVKLAEFEAANGLSGKTQPIQI